MSHVLSTYPLSLPYRTALEQKHGSALSYLTLSGLRSLSPFAMVRQLFSLKGAELQIAIEDESSRALLPILWLLASITRVSSLVVLDGTHERTRLSRWQAALWVLHLCWESLAATFSMAIANAQLGRLKHQSRIDAPIGAGRKVGYLNCNLWFGVKAGGSVGHISGVVNALTQLGHDVDFYTVGGRLMVNDDARYVRLAPPKILALPYEKTLYRFDAACTRQIESEFRRSLPSFIYQRMSIGNFTGVKLSRKFGLPLIIEYNGSEVWVARNWGRPLRHEREASAAEEACLRHAHLIVTISDVLADELIARGVERERIVVYPNCIDPAMFDPAAFSPEEVAELRRSVGLEPRHTVATFVGTFGQWHGADVLARTIASMVRTHKELFNMGLRFLLVGDGAKMPEVRQILSPSEVSPYVTLTGLVPQHEAPRYLAASDLVLAPHVANADGSKFFGSPTKLFEYLAMARGIVASDLDQLGQVLRPAVLVNGKGEVDATDAERALAVLVPPGDVSALSEGIALLVRDLDLRRTLGENARSVALSRYTWKHHVEAILAGLEQVSKSKSGQPPT